MLPDLDAIGMDDVTAAEIDDLARLYNGYGQRTRLAILLGFHYGNSTTDIANALGITRAGLTGHLQQMTAAGLLRSLNKGYELTVLGRYVAEQVEAEKDMYLDVTHILDITRHHLGEEVERDINSREYPDVFEDTVESKLWETVEPELEALLFGDEIQRRYGEGDD